MLQGNLKFYCLSLLQCKCALLQLTFIYYLPVVLFLGCVLHLVRCVFKSVLVGLDCIALCLKRFIDNDYSGSKCFSHIPKMWLSNVKGMVYFIV